jgi:glycosyltransferase involved in cell wall biosynthesis
MSSAMHICFLCNEYPPAPHGGVGSFTRTLARALAARAHRVTVVGYGAHGGSVTHDDGVRVVRLPHASIRGTGLLVNGARLRQALLDADREHQLDIVEGPEGSLAAVPRALRAAAVIRMHGGHHFFAVTLGRRPGLERSWMERRSFSRATHLCAVSRFVAQQTLDLLNQRGRAVEILHNPVDVRAFAPREGGDVDGLILFAGTLCEKKGIRQLVLAMPQIVAAVPHATLWIAGRDTRDPETGGSYAARLRALVPPHLADRVVFKNAVPHADMPALLARASVCAYPSHMEALPLAWLEGMSMAKPVVASRVGPGAEVIEDGVSGLLCDPLRPDAIAATVTTVLTRPALRRRLGDAARARVIANFSEEVLVARNEEFYRRCRSARHDGDLHTTVSAKPVNVFLRVLR